MKHREQILIALAALGVAAAAMAAETITYEMTPAAGW